MTFKVAALTSAPRYFSHRTERVAQHHYSRKSNRRTEFFASPRSFAVLCALGFSETFNLVLSSATSSHMGFWQLQVSSESKQMKALRVLVEPALCPCAFFRKTSCHTQKCFFVSPQEGVIPLFTGRIDEYRGFSMIERMRETICFKLFRKS